MPRKSKRPVSPVKRANAKTLNMKLTPYERKLVATMHERFGGTKKDMVMKLLKNAYLVRDAVKP